MSLRLLILSLTLLFTACSGPTLSTLPEGELVGEEAGDLSAAIEVGDLAWEERLERDAVTQAIEAWSQAATIRDEGLEEAALAETHQALQVKLSRAYFFLADYHIRLSEPKGEARAKARDEAYAQAVSHAERALALCSPGFRDALSKGDSLGEATKQLGPECVPAMYWWGASFGRRLGFMSPLEAMGHLVDFEAMILATYALDPHYYCDGPTRALAGLRTFVPLPSGDLPKAKSRFQEAQEGAPGCLVNLVTYAEIYAVEAKDRGLFERLLGLVFETKDEDLDPEYAPENHFERARANTLMKNVGDFF